MMLIALIALIVLIAGGAPAYHDELGWDDEVAWF